MRDEVKKFAEKMEKVLKENDYKGGWKDSSDDYLQEKLLEEVAEYFQACECSPLQVISNFADSLILAGNEVDALKNHNMVNKKKELADIANICMMLHDNAG
jgi:predicted house-cleaning noncanonical NTP pyrophosphatase (MazG superfamily)